MTAGTGERKKATELVFAGIDGSTTCRQLAGWIHRLFTFGGIGLESGVHLREGRFCQGG